MWKKIKTETFSTLSCPILCVKTDKQQQCCHFGIGIYIKPPLMYAIYSHTWANDHCLFNVASALTPEKWCHVIERNKNLRGRDLIVICATYTDSKMSTSKKIESRLTFQNWQVDGKGKSVCKSHYPVATTSDIYWKTESVLFYAKFKKINFSETHRVQDLLR